MSDFGLRFVGVGNSHALTLGSSAAVLEVGERPCLLIDCGPETVAAYLNRYGELPEAVFVTQPHLNHIEKGGFLITRRGERIELACRLAEAPTGEEAQPGVRAIAGSVQT
jgi:glyoxylase-like metal-dependent hydrolase (beta-lactamase superfamily II)